MIFNNAYHLYGIAYFSSIFSFFTGEALQELPGQNINYGHAKILQFSSFQVQSFTFAVAGGCFEATLSILLYLCRMENTRQQKIARLIQKNLGEIFQALSRDQFQGNMITVTKVHISPDLYMAKSYLSLFGKTDKEELLALINAHKKEIRLKLGNRIHNQVRSIPELEFFIDDSLDYIENIEKLLKS